MHTILHKCAVLCNYLHTFNAFVQELFLQFWVRETRMVNCFEFLDKHGLGIGYVAEGDGALAEIAFGHLRIDQFVDQFTDALLGIVRQ